MLCDFNILSEDSLALTTALSTSRLHDIAVEFAQRNAETPSPTCLSSSRSEPSRIDYMLANHTLIRSVQNFRLVSDSGIPTHTPLLLTLNLDIFAQRILRIRQPLATHSIGAAKRITLLTATTSMPVRSS